MPVTVYVAGGTAGGAPFDGTLVVTYDQDSTQSTQIVRQVAGTPGKVTPVQVMVNVPVSCARMAFVLRDRSGRPVARATFARYPNRDEQPLPDSFRGNEQVAPVVVGIGPETGAASSVRAICDRRTGASAVAPGAVEATLVIPQDMPLTWAGYDGVLLVAVDGDGVLGADPRAMAALREWVSGGGRLVVLASAAGEGWRRWLPPCLAGEITLAEPATGPMPNELDTALGRTLPIAETDREGALRRLEERGDWRRAPSSAPAVPAPIAGAPAAAGEEGIDPGLASYAPADGEPVVGGPLKPVPAESIVQRRIGLSRAAIAAGWSLRWKHEDGSALLAEGAVGFGWVTIVGLDPRRATVMASDAGARPVWADALTNLLADWQEANAPGASPGQGIVWQEGQEFGSLAVKGFTAWSSRMAALDRVAAAVGETGHGLFPLIAASMLLLAALIGPVDAMVLRRLRLRHRSWATALGWIGLATLAAYIAPTLGRGGRTTVSRVAVVDCIAPADSSVPALAWRTGVTGIFAGQSMQRQLEGMAAGSWWRPVAATHEFYWAQEAGTLSQSTRHVQSTPDLSTLAAAVGADDPWGGLGLGPGAGGNVPGPMWLRLWTLRLFIDQGRIAPAVRASIGAEPGALDEIGLVSISDLPAGSAVIDGAIRTSKGWTALRAVSSGGNGAPRAGGPIVLQPEPGPATSSIAERWTPRTIARNWVGGAAAPEDPGQFLALPGTERRSAAMDRLIGTGRWAAIYLEVKDMSPDVRLSDSPDAGMEQTTIYRLLAPLPQTERGPE
jgi:hypothetical protein